MLCIYLSQKQKSEKNMDPKKIINPLGKARQWRRHTGILKNIFFKCGRRRRPALPRAFSKKVYRQAESHLIKMWDTFFVGLENILP
jgi:hypothetical protein